MNKTIFQSFHWYYSAEGNLWMHIKNEAPHMAALGVTDVWLPPAYKSAMGVNEPGYAVYDLYDLGEFNQKDTVRTRFGTKEEYLDCINALHRNRIRVIADIVLNHKLGADEKEEVPVQEVDNENRNEVISEPHTITAKTKFTFPGRKGKYSDYVWDWHSFTGTSKDDSISMILNEHGNGTWEDVMETENGNYDYLMGNDIEFRNPFVKEELKNWGKWYVETTGIDGFRLDAVKHINTDFFPEWLQSLKSHFRKDFFAVGEYWKSNIDELINYVKATGGNISLFDVPLHFNFYDAAMMGKDFDLRTVFDNTLIKEYPDLAVTFVDNHDTQPLQSLESTVGEWFQPIAYALILLREKGTPCVFYPSLYGAAYVEKKEDNEISIELHKVDALSDMMKVRGFLAYGEQYDYFDNPNVIGWSRTGIREIERSGCVVLISNDAAGEKWMSAGKRNAGQTFKNICGNQESVTLNEAGEGLFKVNGGSVAVWINDQNHFM